MGQDGPALYIACSVLVPVVLAIVGNSYTSAIKLMLPDLPSLIGSVCSGYAPLWGGQQTWLG